MGGGASKTNNNAAGTYSPPATGAATEPAPAPAAAAAATAASAAQPAVVAASQPPPQQMAAPAKPASHSHSHGGAHMPATQTHAIPTAVEIDGPGWLPSSICARCLAQPSNAFQTALEAKFPGSLTLDDFVFQTKQLLVPRGFYPQVNTLVCVGLCRDEITSPLEEEVEATYGQAFICGSLGGMLFCGNTGFGAAHHHAPKNGRFVYFCFTHIAIDHEGHIGSVYRTRSGMSEKTTACGALAAFTAEIASGKLSLHLDEDDIEQSMLKKHICRKTQLSTDPAHPPDLYQVTMAAYDTITQDLERHVLHDASLHRDRQYALFSGVQIHGPDGGDLVWLGKSSLVISGVLQPLEFKKHVIGEQLMLAPPAPPTH